MKKSIFEMINEWSTLSYAENPYGQNIPGVFLFSANLVKPPLDPVYSPKCLADLKQDGHAIAYVVNDRSKHTLAENNDCIIYSEIFHELFDAETLCPSNYVKTIIDKVDEENSKRDIKFSFEDYIGFITRGLRAFASYVREVHLSALIKKYFYESNWYNYKVYESDSELDTKEKTDIMFSIGPRLYRVWSYQNTPKGIEKTSNRILKGCSNGYNILLPFDRFKTIYEVNGWHLYNKFVTFSILDNLLNKRANDYENVKLRIKKYGDFVAIPQIFFVP